MSDHDSTTPKKESWQQYSPLIGVVLVVSGLLFLLDQRIKTNWLSLALPVFISVIILTAGIVTKRKILLIPGFICIGLSAAFFILFQHFFKPEKGLNLVGAAIGVFSLSWLFLFLSLSLLRGKIPWWALFVATISGAVSLNLFFERLTLLNFIFTITLAIAVVFLAWGLKKRSLGLLIPGLLISTIGAGVFFAWKGPMKTNGLQETGTMLVWFALGWILISVTSRLFSHNFVWWPLIPGGVLAMVGSGLYIGGNPGNALGFVQNTGSIGLIMFGVYLILLKYSMKK